MKAHLKNGTVCILKDSWAIDTTLNTVGGNGTQYMILIVTKLFKGYINIPIDSVAIFETIQNCKSGRPGRITALSVAGLDVVLGAYFP
ncbi:MAG: hypothetical protein IPI23_13790 [Bacteroidetes bacterium]|nr:hypothetical protein [Bacteroidota bacterium]